MEAFGAYSHAIVALALFAVIGQVLSALAAVSRSGAGFGPGELPPADYGNRVFRVCRAYHNTVDNAGTFAAAVAAAILAGAAPFWVNLFASVALVARIAFVVVYIRGIGAPDLGPRSFIYVTNSAMTILLALMAVVAGVTS